MPLSNLMQTARNNKILHKLLFKECTEASFEMGESSILIDSDGDIRNIKIHWCMVLYYSFL